MQSRRNFLRNSSLLSASLLISPSLFGESFSFDKRKVGLQLYTVRDAMAKDPAGTLSRVAEIGYREVEAATYTGTELFYGMGVAEFSALLKRNGLTMPSGHYALGAAGTGAGAPRGTILNDWEKAVEDAVKVGQKYMVCAFLTPDERKTIDDYKRVAEHFNKAGETCKKAGIQFCYHNHNFEFPEIDGQVPYYVLLNNTDKELVKMEVDLYWITKAGYDPVELFAKHPKRFPLWHVKDMDNTPKKFFTEVGSGTIDFKNIFKHADQAGMKHFFVEQDVCPGSPFDSIAKSIKYIKSTLLKS